MGWMRCRRFQIAREHLASPGEQLARADLMFAGDRADRQTSGKTLGHDRPLLLRRPEPPPLGTRNDVELGRTASHTISRTAIHKHSPGISVAELILMQLRNHH